MRKIITISREFGAGGGEIGERLAKVLGYECYNKELILKAAAKSNVDVQSIIKWDEKVPVEFGIGQSLFEFYNRPLSETLFEAQKNVIREFGEKGNCVIIGRNGNQILKEYDKCLHVFIHADPYWRLNRMKRKMPNVPESKLIEEIRSIDKMRRKYCTFYTNTEFGKAEYYDITLNTSRLGIESCLKILTGLAKEG